MPKYSEYHAIISSPCATLGIKLDQQSVCALDFIFDDVGQPIIRNELADIIAEQLACYFQDANYQFTIQTSPHGTPFQKSVWEKMQVIPSGSCLTYSDVARQLQSGARAVGNACRKNPIPLIIPCHRIVAKNGYGGFAGKTSGPLLEVKQWLLKHESCSIA